MVIMMKSNFFSSRLSWSCKENNFVFMMLCLKNAQLFLLTVTVQILIIFPSCLFCVFMEKLLKHNIVCIFGSYGVNKSLILMWPTDICSDVANITLTETVMPLFWISFEGAFVQITSLKREIKNVNSHKVPICERLQCLSFVM